jgi:hypothetical protein
MTFNLLQIIVNKSVALSGTLKNIPCSQEAIVLFSVDNFVNLTEVAFIWVLQ